MAVKSNEGKVERGFIEIRDDEHLDDEYWLGLCRHGWQQSDDWFNSSLRPRIERNLAHYKSRHEPASKYHREEFRKRSRLFRPRTRTAVRKLVAAATRAFFATEDMVHCAPTDHGNEQNVLAAEIHQIVMNFRLANSIPWYKTVVAGITDASINGCVISKQYWDFRTERREEVVSSGGPEGLQVERKINEYVVHDRPMVRIVPLENIRISPASDWADPMNSTPYIIEQRPYFVTDLKERMENSQTIPYRSVGDSDIQHGETSDFDSIRAKREDSRDRFNEIFAGTDKDYEVVWVRECIVRVDGMDYYYETIGETVMLSDPVPLSRVSKIGRGYVMGYIEIEPHTLNPDGAADMGAGLQKEANEIVNARMDNVKLSMTGRFIVKRGAQTDIRSLMRNVPGSITYSQSTEDVKDMRPRDVTQSAYQEQDRINLDMDDLLGTFSQSTVQSNRAMNETVGGMNMLSEGANELTEFQIRNFSETWYQPVLTQIAELERHYESSANVLKIAGDEYGETIESTFRLIQQPTAVTVNVGFNNLNPIMRIERLSMGLQTMEQFAPGTLAKIDQREVSKEIFGALGYKDGSRFLPHLSKDEEDPRIQQLEASVAELQQIIEMEEVKEQKKIEIEQIRAQVKIQIEQMRNQVKAYTEQLKAQQKQIDQELEREENEINKRQLWMQREALSHTIEQAERDMAMREYEFMVKMGLTPGQPPELPGEGSGELAQSLRKPSSGTPIQTAKASSPVTDMQDEAGVVARGQYGAIPHKRDFMEG